MPFAVAHGCRSNPLATCQGRCECLLIGGRTGANEVFVSRVVTDLVAGAGLKFAERGSFDLKGIPGPWDLFVAVH